MVFIPDLYREHPLKQSPSDTLPVGYLEAGQGYERGNLDVEVIDRLIKFAEWFDFKSMYLGMHWCSLCAAENLYGPDCRSSQRSICVPGEGVFYETSTWIMHYIISHGYRPPDEFCTAVLAAQVPMSLQDIPEKPRWWLSRILNRSAGPHVPLIKLPSDSWTYLYPDLIGGCETTWRHYANAEPNSSAKVFSLPDSGDDTPTRGIDSAKLNRLEEQLMELHGGDSNSDCGHPGCKKRRLEGLKNCLRHAYPVFDFVEGYVQRHDRLPWESTSEGHI